MGISNVGGRDMMLRTGLLALIATTAMISAAMADCRTMFVIFRLSQNESVSTTGISTGGSACGINLRSDGLLHFTSVSIAARPSNGTLTDLGAIRFRYKPRAGFKGVDRYSIRVCGKDSAGSGCATVTYNITVQ